MGGTPAGTLAVRASDLRFPGRETVTAAGTAPSTGEMTAFCRPVLTAPAFVKRDGSVLADAWLPDLVRLGELEAHLGDGVIEDLVAEALEEGRLPRRVGRRIMSYPLVIRLMIAMALMPGASYCEALSRLAGLLADIPFARDWHVPTGKVVTDWRQPVPPTLTEALFWQAAGPLVSEDAPSAAMLAGMPVAGADGMLVNVADTPANRAFFGTTGTGDGSSPFPQVTATSSLDAISAAAGSAARACLHTLNVPAGNDTPGGSRKPARNSGTPPSPSRPSPGNPRSPSSHPASTDLASRPCDHKEVNPLVPRPVEPRARPAAPRGHRPCPPGPRKRARKHGQDIRTTTS